VFQAAYGSLMTLSGLEHGIFIDRQDPGVARARSSIAITWRVTSKCVSRPAVGLMLAELSSRSAAGWRDSARQLLRTLLGNKARVRLALVIMVTGLVLTRSRMGNTAFFASLTGVGCFYLLAVRKLSGRTITFFASLLVIDLLVVGNFFGIEKVAQRIQQTSTDPGDRVDTDRDAVAMLRDFPLTGIGAGSFYAVYPMYTSAVVVTGFTRHAQRRYLQFACEFGWCLRPCWRRRAGLALDGHSRPTQAPRTATAGHGLRGHHGLVAPADSFGVDFNLQIRPTRRCSRHGWPSVGLPVLGSTDGSPGARLIVFWCQRLRRPAERRRLAARRRPGPARGAARN